MEGGGDKTPKQQGEFLYPAESEGANTIPVAPNPPSKWGLVVQHADRRFVFPIVIGQEMTAVDASGMNSKEAQTR